MRHSLTLADGDIRVRPLEAADAPALRALADDEIWAGMSSPLPRDDAAMAAHLEAMGDRPGLLAFTVERAGRIVGRTTFYDLVPEVRSCVWERTSRAPCGASVPRMTAPSPTSTTSASCAKSGRRCALDSSRAWTTDLAGRGDQERARATMPQISRPIARIPSAIGMITPTPSEIRKPSMPISV